MIRRSSFTKGFCIYGFLLLCATLITNLQAQEPEVPNADEVSSNFTEPTDPPSFTDVSTEITTRDPLLQHIVKIVVAYSNTFNRTAFETEFRLWWIKYCAQPTKCQVTPTTIAISTSTESTTPSTTTQSTPESITEGTTVPQLPAETTAPASAPTPASTDAAQTPAPTEAAQTPASTDAVQTSAPNDAAPQNRKRRAVEDGAATPVVIVVPVQVTIRNIETTNDGKTAIVEFYVATKDGLALGKAVVEGIVKEEEEDIAKAVGADKVTIDVQPSPSPVPGGGGSDDSLAGWKIAVIVIAIILLVALLIGLIIALRRKQRADEMYNLTTRSPGDGSQYLGQRPLTQTFDNAAYNKSSETVRIGSFDKP